MAAARYEIYPSEDGWVIKHDNESSQPYEFPEAAFEAAVAAASLSLKNKHDVSVTVTHQPPGRRPMAEQQEIVSATSSQQQAPL